MHSSGLSERRSCRRRRMPAALGVALAADPKPDISIKTKALEASVFLDDKIKADAALAANSLAEGKKWATKNRADAEKERKRTRRCSATAPGRLSANTRRARWSMAVMSASSGPTTKIPAARIPTVRRRHDPVGHGRRQAHQHPSVLHRNRRQRPDHEGDAARRHRLAEGREEEARRWKTATPNGIKDIEPSCSRSAR